MNSSSVMVPSLSMSITPNTVLANSSASFSQFFLASRLRTEETILREKVRRKDLLQTDLLDLCPLDQTVLGEVVQSEGPSDLLVQGLVGEIEAEDKFSEVDVSVLVEVQGMKQLDTESFLS